MAAILMFLEDYSFEEESFFFGSLWAPSFWDWQSVLLIDFINPQDIINANVHCRQTIQNQHQGLLSSYIIFLNSNSRLHMQNFKWGTFNHPTNSSGLDPSDFHLFTRTFWQKKKLGKLRGTERRRDYMSQYTVGRWLWCWNTNAHHMLQQILKSAR